MHLTVNAARCPQNHRCPVTSVCPVDAIAQDGYGLPKVDPDKCTSCMKCTRYCPMGAFEQVE